MAIEYIVPNDDNTDGFWTNSDSNTTDLYSYVDNGISGGTPDDTTYIESSSAISALDWLEIYILGQGPPKNTASIRKRQTTSQNL